MPSLENIRGNPGAHGSGADNADVHNLLLKRGFADPMAFKPSLWRPFLGRRSNFCVGRWARYCVVRRLIRPFRTRYSVGGVF
jgi:hypothetical protein